MEQPPSALLSPEIRAEAQRRQKIALQGDPLARLIADYPLMPPRNVDDVGVQDGDTLESLSAEQYRAKVAANRERRLANT